MTAPVVSSSPPHDDPVAAGGGQRAADTASAWLTRRKQVGWSAVWLAFLAYPIADIVSHPHPVPWLAAAWAALGVFVALYLGTMYHAHGIDQRATPWPAAAWLMAFIAFTLGTTVAFGTPWGGSIIYLGVATGATLGPRPTLATLAGIDAATVAIGVVIGAGASDVAFICFLTSALGVTMLGARRMLALIVELREARDEVARLTAAEQRLRFSRDLHDVLGHNLSAAALSAQVARRTMDSDPEAAAGALADMEAVVHRSLAEVRQLVAGYREASLDEELAGARELLGAARIAVRVDRPASLPGGQADGLLAWAVREGVTNVIRHARATWCGITVAGTDGWVSVEILDDGKGPLDSSPGGGSGLAGLRERMGEAGGSLQVGRGSGGGFRLLASVPTGR